MGVMGFGETKFLKTPNAENGRPNLDDFDKEIEVFQVNNLFMFLFLFLV